MYFVDRNKIEAQLEYLHQLLDLLEQQRIWETPIEKAALERIVHMTIEAALDVGNSMIDGFIMRDPGSYEDIVEILTDEKVIPTEVAEELKFLLHWRKSLVHDYTNINHKQLYDDFSNRISSLKNFSTGVKAYLIHELGPVTAFKN